MGKHHRKDQQDDDIDVQAGSKDQDEDKGRGRRVVNIAPPGSIVGIQTGGDVHGSTVHISRGQR